jgi:transcriptional regulator with XRE-family HTH domain
MSQQKKLEKLELGKRIREFRHRAKLSQTELGDRLGISGNYVSMIELSKKDPGPSLKKLFEAIEHSPLYAGPGTAPPPEPADPLYAMLSMETLIQNFAEVADKLPQSSGSAQKRVVSSLRDMLGEIEARLLASSSALSEAQDMAVKAARGGGNRGIK